jgi:tetratricopeptide (TPR) repeat protein
MPERAIRLLRNALDIHTGHPELRIKLAETLQLNHEHAEALDLISDVLRADPLNMPALERYKILLQERTGESAYFLIWSEELLRQYPHNSDLYITVASAYRDDVQDDRAEEVYKEGLKNNPHDFQLKMVLADFFVSAGKYTEAIDLYKQYITENPENPYGYLQLGHVYLNVKDHEQAYAFYKKALALAPEYAGEISQSLAGQGLTPDDLFHR